MAEHSILFTPEMVAAIKDRLKTQTRRVVKPQPDTPHGGRWAFTVSSTERSHIKNPWAYSICDPEGNIYADTRRRETARLRCPYGVTGDLLVPCTTWATTPEHDKRKPKDIVASGYMPPFWSYWQSDTKPEWCGKSRPGRFLPRELWWTVPRLEVTGVRVERLQEISEDDARAEGIRRVTKDGDLCKYCVFDEGDMSSTAWADMPRTAIEAFRQLWDSINARRGLGWEANLWVWVIEFRPLGARHAG